MLTNSAYQLVREEEKRILQSTTVFLFQVASLFTSKRFHWYFKTSKSRFSWMTENTHAMLRRDVLRQGYHVVHRDRLREGMAVFLELIGKEIERHAEQICESDCISVSKKDRKFVLPKEASGAVNQTKCYLALLEKLSSDDVNIELAVNVNKSDSFYIDNFIATMRLYLEARLTLVEPLPDANIEKFLEGLNESYVVQGYPTDLLALDAGDLRAGRKGIALATRKEYLSTAWVSADALTSLLTDPGYTCIRFQKK